MGSLNPLEACLEEVGIDPRRHWVEGNGLPISYYVEYGTAKTAQKLAKASLSVSSAADSYAISVGGVPPDSV